MTVAKLELARVLVLQGDRAGARPLVEDLLARWGNADRPVPEVAAARKLLVELGPP